MDNVGEYEILSVKKLSAEVSGYYNTGAADSETLKENCEAYKRWRFRPRVMRNVVNVDTSTAVLGSKIPFPICVAPTAFHQLAHQEGEIATAKAAESFGIGMTLSMSSNRTLEEVAENAPKCLKWCHMQVCGSKDLMRHLIGRAEKNGYSGLVITVDQPVFGQRPQRSANGRIDFIEGMK